MSDAATETRARGRRTCDRRSGVGATLRTAIDCSSERLRELVGMLVERIKVTEDGEYAIEPVPAAWQFFAAAESLLLAPPDGFEPPIPTQRAGLVPRGPMRHLPASAATSQSVEDLHDLERITLDGPHDTVGL
jgi:hypothetical protein